MTCLKFIFVLILLFVCCTCELIRQCRCQEVESCKRAYTDAILPCGDSCKRHAESAGANHQRLRQCFAQIEPQVRAAILCFEIKTVNSCANSDQMIQKRYPETLKIAVMAEADRIIKQSGLTNDLRDFVTLGKKTFSCMNKCMDKRSNQCATTLRCGLKLPSDNVIIRNIEQCALEAGLNNKAIQQACECAVNAGIRKLANICSRLIIF